MDNSSTLINMAETWISTIFFNNTYNCLGIRNTYCLAVCDPESENLIF